METSCQSSETEFGRNEHTVQFLEKGDDTAQLSAVFETDDTKTESCQQGKLLGLSAVAEVQRNSSSLGNGQRRNLSSMTKVLSLILAAAQHLDSSCTDCWNRAFRFGRPDLLEVCANSDSPLVEAVESAGGEGLRTSFRNGYAVANVSISYVQLKGQDTLGSLHLDESLEHHHNVCLVFWMESQPWSRELQALGCHVHFVQPNSVSSRRQNSLRGMSEKMMKAVVNGCAWGLRDPQGSLLSRSWQVLTTSPDVQRVLNHRQHCHRQRHLLLMRVQTHQSEWRSPIGYKRIINRLDIVTLAPWWGC